MLLHVVVQEVNGLHDYDITLKYLSDKFPEHFVNLIFEGFDGDVELLDKELPLSRRDSDYLVTVKNGNCVDGDFILHIEFQSSYDARMPERMLSYYTRIREKHKLPVYPVVIYLNSEDCGSNIKDIFENSLHGLDIIKFRYKVLKLWELDADTIIDNCLYGLYPIVPLTEHGSMDDGAYLAKFFDIVNNIDIEDKVLKADIAACTGILAGLKYSKELISSLMKVELMKESVIYQSILSEGKAEGMEKSIVAVLSVRFGDIPDNLSDSIYHVKNESLLDSLLRLAATTNSLSEFKRVLQHS